MRLGPTVLAVLVLLGIVSCATTDLDTTEVSVFADYASWKRVNSETITGDGTGTLGRNVHQGSTGYRDVYVNAAGEAASSGAGELPYPVGTVFVKNSFADADGAMDDLADVTVMIKRGTGYDPDNGDWEYVLLSPDLVVRNQGAINGCIQCHSTASDRDYVFASY